MIKKRVDLYILSLSFFAVFFGSYVEAQTVSLFDIEITGTPQDIDVRFGNGTGFTTGLDIGYDAGYIFTATPTNPEDDVLGDATGIYTLLVDDSNLIPGTAFMIQTLPYADIADMEIPLGVNIAADGSETIYLENISAFPAGHRIILEDRGLGVFTELQGATDSYTVALTVDEPEKGRFFLHTTNDTTAPMDPGLLTAPISPNNDIDAAIIGSCGVDAPKGSVKVTTTPTNGFSNNYDVPVQLDENGAFTITNPNWSEGSYTLSYSCRDKVGNGPTVMEPFGPIVIDTTVPSTPTTPDLQGGSDTGITNTDNHTSDNTPTFDLTCTEIDSTITLYANGVPAGTHTCSAIGSASITASPLLVDSTYDFTISETDLAGNELTQSSALTVTIDTTIDPITINAPTTGASLSGTADANSTVTITTPSGAACTTMADVTGTYTCTLAPSPVNGEDITATSTDLYGNTANTTEAGAIDVNAPTTPVINPVIAGATTIIGTGEDGTTITLDIATCTNAPVIVVGGVWSCTLDTDDAPNKGDRIVVTSADFAGNYSTGAYSIPKPKSGSKRKTTKEIATIFDKDTDVVQATLVVSPTESNPFGGEPCPAHLLITNNMKDGDTNGVYSSYNQGIVTEVSILQTHINRLLKDDYGYQAAGSVDNWFRSKTKLGVERLQTKLNQLLEGKIKPLTIDGIVGPYTKAAINMSC